MQLCAVADTNAAVVLWRIVQFLFVERRWLRVVRRLHVPTVHRLLRHLHYKLSVMLRPNANSADRLLSFILWLPSV